MEVGQAVLALNFIHPELDLSKGMILVLLQICQRYLKDSPLQSVICVLQTCAPIDQSFPDAFMVLGMNAFEEIPGGGDIGLLSDLESRWRLYSL